MGRGDIYKVINQVLRIGKLHFDHQDFSKVFKANKSLSISCLEIMIDFDLIAEIENIPSKKYRVVEPKLIYLIQNGVKSLKDSNLN